MIHLKKLFRPLGFSRCLYKYIFIAAGWSVLIATSLGWNIYQIHENMLDTVVVAARTSISKDIIFRKWATSHGGVYVPPTKNTPPNPYLKVPERDVVTTTGKVLTLMNPAYMFRQLQEHFAVDMGRSHITSLKLLNPHNQADEWETKALQDFERGSKESQEIQHINEQPYLRLMQPLIAEQGCLKCHAAQGYKVGDIRGGISTAIPLASYLVREQKQSIELAISHALIWLSGLIGLHLFYWRENRFNQQREQAEEILKFHSYILTNMAEGLYLTRTSDQRIVYTNPKFEQMFGYQSGELLGQHVSIVNAPNDKNPDDIANAIISELNRTGSWSGEVHNIRKNGTTFWCRACVSSFNHPQFGQVWLSVHEDITEQKSLQKQIADQLAFNEAVIDAEVNALAVCHGICEPPYVRFTVWNPSMETLTGYSIEEINRLGWYQSVYIDPKVQEKAKQRMERMRQGEHLRGEEWVISRKNGEQRIVLIYTVTVLEDERGRHVLAVMHDITERKQAEEKLKLSERRAEALLELTNRANTLTEAQLLQAALDQAESLTGSDIAYALFVNEDQETLTLGTWSTKTLPICNAAYDNHYPISQAGVWAECFRQKRALIHNDYPALTTKKGLPEGHTQLSRVMSVPVMDGDKVQMIIGVGNKAEDYDPTDLTQLELIAASLWSLIVRKRSEIALREAEEKYRTVADFAGDWETWIDPQDRYLYVSPSCQRITGYSAAEFIADSLLTLQIIHPDDQTRVTEHFKLLKFSTQEESRIEFRLLTKTGEILWIEHVCCAVINEKGVYLGRRASNRDITKRKQAEDALRKSEQKYLSLVNDIGDKFVIFSHDLEGVILYVSNGFTAFTGIPKENIIGQNWMTAFDWQFGSIDAAESYDLTTGEIKFAQFEMVYRHSNGSARTIQISEHPVFDETGAVISIDGIAEDITERKQAEAALRKTQNRLNEAQRIAKTGNWELNLLDNSLFWSDEIFHIFEIDQTRFGATYQAFLSIIHPEDRDAVNAAYTRSLENREPYSITHRLLMPDGSIKYVHEQCETDYNPADQAIRSFGTVQDITERVLIERELEQYRYHLENLVDQRTAELVQAKETAEAAEHSLRESEAAVRRKLAALLEPEGDLGDFALEDILDVPELQALMDEFYRLTHIGCAIIDLKGKVLVSNGWQDICTQFHRRHPETLAHCIESDTQLSKGAPLGTYKCYHCKNTMWDMATPIIIGGDHIGNIFLGQFFFDDEEPDIAAFKQQAARYGFDEQEYLAALERVPRWSRETLDALMMFYSRLAAAISRLSYSTVKLARTLAERDRTAAALIEAKEAAEAANIAKSTFIATMSHELRTPLNAVMGFSELMTQDDSLNAKQKENLRIIHRSGVHLLTVINDILEISKIETGRLELSIQAFDLHKLLHEMSDKFKICAENKQLNFSLEISSNVPRYVKTDSGKLRQVLFNLLDNALKFTAQGQIILRSDALPLPAFAKVMLEIEVIDSGTGILADKLDDLFKPFVQLARRDSGLEGTGLGLTMCKSLIDLMGGKITVSTVHGVGSTFKIELPVSTANAADVAVQADLKNTDFIYPAQFGSVSSVEWELTPEMLSSVPLKLRQQLLEAASNLDIDETDAVIAQIHSVAPEIANGLQDLAECYQFEQIIQMLEAANSR